MTLSDIPSKERLWGMFGHLSSLLGLTCIPFAHLLAPFLIWQIKKEEMPFASSQAKECLNFQISMSIYAIISAILCLVVIGFVFLAILYVMDLVFTIIAAVKANDGVAYRYPFTIRFIQ